VKAWLLRHLQTFFFSLGQLSRAPASTLLTASVIGIALALPCGLYLLLQNAEALTGRWEGTAQLSLFLSQETSAAQAEQMASVLRGRPEVAAVRLITPTEALAEYREMSRLGEVLDALEGDNPLPTVLVVDLGREARTSESAETLAAELQELPAVELAQYDLQWLERLFAILEVVRSAVLIAASLLAVGVVLVVGNTIRLGIDNRREEIEIARLFGATDAFIRRPFLYSGFFYGLLGAVLAWVALRSALALLGGPVSELAALYGSAFGLNPMGPGLNAALIGGGAGLGLVGSWVAVGRHLSAIEPS
jgi:cell division transport system permease protein